MKTPTSQGSRRLVAFPSLVIIITLVVISSVPSFAGASPQLSVSPDNRSAIAVAEPFQPIPQGRKSADPRPQDIAFSYYIVDLGVGLRPWDINNRRQVVGQNTLSNRPFYWDDGEAQAIPTLGSSDDIAYAINDLGTVVGQMMVLDGEDQPVRAFSWQRYGNLAALPTVGGETFDGGGAFGINQSGQIAGSSTVGFLFGHYTLATHAVVWRGGAPIDLTPDNEWMLLNAARDVNDEGRLVGIRQEEDGVVRAYTWYGGSGTELMSCSGYCTAEAINNRGQIVGVADDVPYIWHNGIMTDTGTLGNTFANQGELDAG